MTFEELNLYEGDILFTSSWCGPCSVLKKQLAAHVIDIKIVVIDEVEESRRISEKYNIKTVPTLLTLNKGAVENRMAGSGDILQFLLDKHKPVA